MKSVKNNKKKRLYIKNILLVVPHFSLITLSDPSRSSSVHPEKAGETETISPMQTTFTNTANNNNNNNSHCNGGTHHLSNQ